MGKSSFQKFRESFESAVLKAHKPLIWLDCFDYQFIIETIKELCDRKTTTLTQDKVRIWSNSDQLERNLAGKERGKCKLIEDAGGDYVFDGKQYVRYDAMQHGDATEYPRYTVHYVPQSLQESIVNFTQDERNQILIARVNGSMFDTDSGSLISALQDFVYRNNKKGQNERRTIILIASYHIETQGLEHICEYFSLPLPDKDDIQQILGYKLEKDEAGNPKMTGEGNAKFPFACDFTGKHYEELIDALYGMDRYDIVEFLQTLKSESKFKVIQYYYKKSEGGKLPTRIKDVKKQLVKNSGLLEVVEYEEGIHNEVGDIDNLKSYLQMERALMSNPEFLSSQLPKPRGILLVGAPGCGKSSAAKATASILNLDLYRLNIGDLLGHKYGQSENQFNEALRTADASAPCVLWIDEIEKAFAGAGNSSNNDDTLTHIVGRFLTWMQEHKTLVYLVATANDLTDLKPEMKRKGRWDEIFYLGYPGEEGRKNIFKVCLNKYRLTEKNFPLDEVVRGGYLDKMDKMSGAEIESFIINVAKYYMLLNSRVTGRETDQEKEKIKKDITEKVKAKIEELLDHSHDKQTYEDYTKNKIPLYEASNYKPASERK